MKLDEVVSREVLADHDGRSGATLERVVLGDGRRLVVKRSNAETDLVVRTPAGRLDREMVLFTSGALDGLPAGIGHCLEDVTWDGPDVVTVMRDLGEEVIGWDRPVDPVMLARLLGAVSALHAHFVERPLDVLCDLADRLLLLSPSTVRAVSPGDHPLPPLVLRGWEIFNDLVPWPVAAAVAGIFEDPTGFTAAWRRSAPLTLVHGDFTVANLAVGSEQVTFLDWGLATAAPAALDLASFLAANASVLPVSREKAITEFRATSGELTTDASLRLAMVSGLLELGWNKALDAVDHPDGETRARERADLDWWVNAAMPALEQDL